MVLVGDRSPGRLQKLITMELICLGSSSKGNCYLLKGRTQTLILEAGVKISEVKQSLDFDLSSIIGCLVTHEHGDHAGHVKELLQAGIDVYTSYGTKTKIQPNHTRLIICVEHGFKFKLGQFTILPIKAVHDAAEPLMFLIRHPECGDTLFCTDSMYIEYKIKGLNNLLIEANYDNDIIDERVANGANKSVRDRVMFSHMSLQSVKEFLQENDTTVLNNIVLLHLSDGNSHAKNFKSAIDFVVPGKQVWIADKKMTIPLDKTPF